MYSTLNNGVKIPLLGLGTYKLWAPEVEVIVKKAIEQGYRLIDTAAGYKNERQIGDVLKHFIPGTIKRSDVFITSKLGPDSHGTDKARKAGFASLDNLQLDFLDLYLIHWPGSSGVPSNSPRNSELRRESWIELEKLYFEGYFKAIGVSNYTISHLRELLQYCKVMPSVLQIEIHPYLLQQELRQFCEEHGIHVQAYSSLGSAEGCCELLKNPAVIRIANEVGSTSAQVLLKWALQHNISVIPKTTKLERVEENFCIPNILLSPEQMQKLDELDKGFHFCWDSQNVT